MIAQEYIRLDMQSVRQLARNHPAIAETYADERLLGYAQTLMKDKLEICRSKGRGGWWDETQCSIDDLKALLKEHIEKGDYVDVMNISAMICARECSDAPGPITTAEQACSK